MLDINYLLYIHINIEDNQQAIIAQQTLLHSKMTHSGRWLFVVGHHMYIKVEDKK